MIIRFVLQQLKVLKNSSGFDCKSCLLLKVFVDRRLFRTCMIIFSLVFALVEKVLHSINYLTAGD